jgi:hypothetical protein
MLSKTKDSSLSHGFGGTRKSFFCFRDEQQIQELLVLIPIPNYISGLVKHKSGSREWLRGIKAPEKYTHN